MKMSHFRITPVATLVMMTLLTPALAEHTTSLQDDTVMTVTSPAYSPLEIVTSPKTPRQPVL
ncbi:MAG: hypothetical protein XXXJIFNMEKO3_00272 [Candidatus Erwinia impunctatus]|nr:hypothetical protein XXXJIFNMEKO_00272 [Culicoides impunctatus]